MPGILSILGQVKLIYSYLSPGWQSLGFCPPWHSFGFFQALTYISVSCRSFFPNNCACQNLHLVSVYYSCVSAPHPCQADVSAPCQADVIYSFQPSHQLSASFWHLGYNYIRTSEPLCFLFFSC